MWEVWGHFVFSLLYARVVYLLCGMLLILIQVSQVLFYHRLHGLNRFLAALCQGHFADYYWDFTDNSCGSESV